jgi:plastocyanin
LNSKIIVIAVLGSAFSLGSAAAPNAVTGTLAIRGEAPLTVTGTISGTVTIQAPAPRRRTADRYAGSATTSVVQTLSAVVYLRGAIPGAPSPVNNANSTMAQHDSSFAPSTISLMAGGSVSFPNGDPFFHNVFSYSGPKRFDLGRYPQGDSKEVVFDKTGVVEVFCEVHAQMAGVIVVTENPYHAVVASDGSFVIADVPVGEYTLVVWHAEHSETERSVSVTEGGNVRIEVELSR